MGPEAELLIGHFKALADPVRLRLLVLCSQGECSVSELTAVLGQSQPRVSQHLKMLCEAGLLERFRDGRFVYYRVPARDGSVSQRGRLLDLLPQSEPLFAHDVERLRRLRGATLPTPDEVDRPLHRALVELTVTASLGDLLDIGCGHGRILKLLASRAQRAVGVDIDADARRFARAELLLAGLPNCTLRQGDMYALPFAEAEFDTIILDDVLTNASQPVAALAEAVRLLRPGGRMLLLSSLDEPAAEHLESRLASWCRQIGLRLTSPRHIPHEQPRWILSVATTAASQSAAA